MPLIERQQERSALSDAIEAGRSGTGRVAAIEGPPGIGKTRLLSEAALLAGDEGMTVLAARGSEIEREHPYGICRQLFEPLLRSADPERREALLSGAGMARELLDPDAGEGEGDRAFGLLNGLFWLTADLAQSGPLLLSVDDLHWADGASIRFLAYLARRIDELGVTICVAMRPGDSEADRRLIDALTDAARTTWMRPSPLSEPGAEELVRSCLGSDAEPEFCAACHRASGGNPLLLGELLRALAAEEAAPVAAQVAAVEEIGPGAVCRTVRQRLSPLPDAHRRFVECMAILGDGAPLSVARELADLDEATVASALDSLCRLEVLVAEPAIGFAHPLVRDALLEELGPGEVRQLHGRAAGLLAGNGARPREVARHLLLAGPKGEESSVAVLREAGAEALGAGDPEAAAAFLRRALEEPPAPEARPAVLLELAGAERLLDHEAAAARVEEALPLIEDRVARASAQGQLAALLLSVRSEYAVEIGLEAIRELGEDSPELRHRLQATVLTAGLLAPKPVPEALLGPARSADATNGVGSRMLAGALGYVEARANEPSAEVVALIRSGFPTGWTAEMPVVGAQLMVAMPALIAADSDDALVLSEEWAQEAQRRGSLSAFGGAKMARARALVARGELDDAVADATDALEALETYRLRGAAFSWALAALAEALIERGELEAAGEALARAEDTTSSVALHGQLATRARLRGILGDPRGALQDTLELGRRFELLGGRNPALLPWRSRAALLLCELGEEQERARRLAREEVELARAWGAPRAIGRALTAAGRATGGEDGVALLEQATATLEAAPTSLERARALIALGSAQRRLHSPVEAREPLREAAGIAASAGAGPLEQRARDELVASGARPRKAAVVGLGTLTSRERRVAELAAEGNSNREIGQQLYLTTRTVESHLTRIYRKLEISSRSQLESALEDGPPASRPR